MRANLDGLTARPSRPLRPATPFLAAAGVGVTLAHLWVSASLGAVSLGALLTTVLVAACCATWVVVRIKRHAARLASALVGLPTPVEGWTRRERRTIDVLSGRRELPVAVAAPGHISDFLAFVSLVFVAYIPALGLADIATPMAAAVVFALPTLVACALAGLAFAWRADDYLQSRLVPLTERVADAQIAVLTEAA